MGKKRSSVGGPFFHFGAARSLARFVFCATATSFPAAQSKSINASACLKTGALAVFNPALRKGRGFTGLESTYLRNAGEEIFDRAILGLVNSISAMSLTMRLLVDPAPASDLEALSRALLLDYGPPRACKLVASGFGNGGGIGNRIGNKVFVARARNSECSFRRDHTTNTASLMR